jgi:hypothetical protein
MLLLFTVVRPLVTNIVEVVLLTVVEEASVEDVEGASVEVVEENSVEVALLVLEVEYELVELGMAPDVQLSLVQPDDTVAVLRLDVTELEE